LSTPVISRALRIVFGLFLLAGSIIGCIVSFREGDRQTGYILIVVGLMAAYYLYAGITGKKGFGNI
jgi:hypothetical protein